MDAAITISRSSNDKINIRLRDKASGVSFVEFQMALEAFAFAVTGLGEVPGTMDVRGLEHVGKTRVSEPRRTICPLGDRARHVLEAWLAENAKEDGWVVDPYLGSQGSVTHEGDSVILNYRVTKYI